MKTDSDFARLTAQTGRITFDPTINAGHILTIVGFLVSGFVAYFTLDKRLAVNEQRTSIVEMRIAEDQLQSKAALRDISLKLDRLIERQLSNHQAGSGK